MHPSSIFSFETLQLGSRSLSRGTVVLLTTVAVVVICEGVLRTDSSPKSLPFRNTREGTIMDVLSEKKDGGLDLVFLGSSQCAYNISPTDVWSSWGRSVPVNAINLGMAGCNIRTVDNFYAAFPTQLNAKITVVVCSPLGMNGPIVADAIQSPGRDYLNGSLPLPEKLLMKLYVFRYRRLYRNLRYQYYLLRTGRLEADLDRRLGPYRCGWRPGQGILLDSTDLNRSGADPDNPKRLILPGKVEVWQSLAEMFRQTLAQDSKVICLVPPHPPRFDDMVERPVAMWDDFLRELSAVCREEGVMLLDQHQLAEFGNASFFDHTHLKNDDARRYSRYLGQEFAKIKW